MLKYFCWFSILVKFTVNFYKKFETFQIEIKTFSLLLMSGFQKIIKVIYTLQKYCINTVNQYSRIFKGRGIYYKSTSDCLYKTITKEGVMSLYKGFVPIWSRIAPWSVIFWVVNEELRKFIGLQGF